MPPEFFKIPTLDVFTNFVRVQWARPFATDLMIWEWVTLIVCLLIGLIPWFLPRRPLVWIRRRLHNYAQNRWRAILTCALFPVVIRVALLPAVPLKPPSIHDEFSWLLMADTFRSGRLTNPTHPLWQHFETIHVIQKPTYNSMYPPAFGALIAFGDLLHNPWIGVLVSVALMCGAICWMLQAWLPPAWAFGGSLIAAARIGIGGSWANGYVGGAPVPAMAGALLVGSMIRLISRPTRTTASVFALAVALLINTRPFEGSIVSGICAAIIVWRLKNSPTRSAITLPMLGPAALILVVGVAFTLYYSWRVTGDPLKMPYVVNRETYGWPENLALLPPQKVVYRHKILKDMHLIELSRRDRYSTLGRMLASWSARYVELWEYFVGPALTPAVLFLPFTMWSRRYRIPIYVLALTLLLNTLQLMAYPQHVAIAVGPFYLLLTAGMRYLYVNAMKARLRPERLMAAIVICLACSISMHLTLDQLHPKIGAFWEWAHLKFGETRAAMTSKLAQMPGKHLVFVCYSPSHVPHEEWVYNRADIDGSKIVWANSMSAHEDLELLRYFHDRQAWTVWPDRDPGWFWPLADEDVGCSQRQAVWRWAP